jgi:ABC-type Zn uptake system ZnuABC Zn-binding protein ZnuA
MFRTALLSAWMVWGLFLPHVAAQPPSRVMVSTSILETAVKDLLPSESGIIVVLLLPPSTCPGHSDLAPSILPALKNATLVLRHDYQGFLDKRFDSLSLPASVRGAIPTPGSLLIPSNYGRFLEQTADLLESAIPEHRLAIRRNLKKRLQSLPALEIERDRRFKHRVGRAVLVSARQAEFCTSVGLQVVGRVPDEQASPSVYSSLSKTKARLIVANLQEGTATATGLAKRLRLPIALLSNFPNAEGFPADYESFFRENLRRLDQACATTD